MKLTFPVDKITTEFIEPFQNAQGPPVMMDPEEYDPTDDHGGLIDLVQGNDGTFFLFSQRSYSGDWPAVFAKETNATSGNGHNPKSVDRFSLLQIIGMVESAIDEGREELTIKYTGEPSPELQALHDEEERMAKAAEKLQAYLKGKAKERRENKR